MRALFLNEPDAHRKLHLLDEYITNRQRADYVYMYPPRQAYRRIDECINRAGELALSSANMIENVYLHVPFCRQICNYCNLYAIAVKDDSPRINNYIESLKNEMEWFGTFDVPLRLSTLYVGGGTPSMLSTEQLSAIIEVVTSKLDISTDNIRELALEVAPDTVDHKKLTSLRSIGFNRVNLGVQTTSSSGLVSIGRKYSNRTAMESVEHAMNANFDNVCADLIYGLPGQSLADWKASIDSLLSLGVPTICVYPLTLRPGTGYSRTLGSVAPENDEQYSKYRLARDACIERGYVQETHVRFSLSGDGYLQKKNHWAGESIVGFGAGARSYLGTVDVQNAYSIAPRHAALHRYQMGFERTPWEAGFVLDKAEQIRKKIILGLNRIDDKAMISNFGCSVSEFDNIVFEGLSDRGLISETDGTVGLTRKGVEFRDLIVQLYFSEEVNQAISEFCYVGG